MRVLIVTDAWYPQVNGVVRTLDTVAGLLGDDGVTVDVIGPNRFLTVPCPSYPEIRLAVDAFWRLPAMIDGFDPDAVHIATEGPLGYAARRYCRRRGFAFTTSFHTRFPEYIHARTGLPTALFYAILRRFHAPATRVMVATRSIHDALATEGFAKLAMWSRGVDTDLFHPRDKSFLAGPRPVWLYVGRIAVEKNVEAFLRLDLPGTKYVVGDGPRRAALERAFPDARFTGAKTGEELARHFAGADVFVFPSRTDTFGLVLLEALASGVPVAAYPVPGPLDVVDGEPVGYLDEDLGRAARRALDLPAQACRDYALRFNWQNCASRFRTLLTPVVPERRAAFGAAPAAGETAPPVP